MTSGQVATAKEVRPLPSLLHRSEYPIMPQPPSEQTRWFTNEVYPHEARLRAWLQRQFTSASDTDDIIQDSYLRVLHAHQEEKLRAPKAFLFIVARNVMRDLVRRRKMTAAVPMTERASQSVMDESLGGPELVNHRQELALLTEAIQALPARCRQVFLLRKINGLSQKEIAANLDITENTVETLVAKGVRRCGAYLRNHGVERILSRPSRQFHPQP